MEVLPIQPTLHVDFRKQNSKFLHFITIKLLKLSRIRLKHASNMSNFFSEYYFDPRPILQDPKYTVQVDFLSKRLEEEIRAAKRTHLSCGEVLLPCGLLQKVSEDILKISEKELCGVRGMNLYLLFEGEEDCRRLSNFKMDPTTPSTFEIYLTFKQANAGWTFLPQFLK